MPSKVLRPLRFLWEHPSIAFLALGVAFLFSSWHGDMDRWGAYLGAGWIVNAGVQWCRNERGPRTDQEDAS